jgi:UDP-galactopyranose mutase
VAASVGGDESPRFLVVGAGLSGAVLARSLAEAGCQCDVFEERTYAGGHCHTVRDRETGVLIHRHGPHTLHTDDAEIWAFVERFAEIYPYRHLKRALTGGELYVSPINLQTLNQFFHKALGPQEARALVAAEAAPYAAKLSGPPANFEEAGLAAIGKRLFDAFYRGYTVKQWGIDPKALPASVFGRVPVRFDYDDNYFHHSRQGQPVGGYSQLIERILDHPNIRLSLGRPFVPEDDASGYRHVFYSGPLDRYFNWRHGRLAYRTLRFEDERSTGVRQGCSVINCCDQSVPYTRVTEHKFFSAWEKPEGTVISYEFSADCGPGDTPYYPLRLTGDRSRLDAYVATARASQGISFIGRLGTYRYIDMHVAIREAMEAASATLDAVRASRPIPAFFVDP